MLLGVVFPRIFLLPIYYWFWTLFSIFCFVLYCSSWKKLIMISREALLLLERGNLSDIDLSSDDETDDVPALPSSRPVRVYVWVQLE